VASGGIPSSGADLTNRPSTPMRTMLSPTEAAETILHHITTLPARTVSLMDGFGHVLATDVASPLDLPPWDNAAMDGYAVRTEDVRGRCPTTLTVVEHLPAGSEPERRIAAGECMRIFTGAPIPAGADSVIRQEHTTVTDPGRVQIESDQDAGGNIRRRGEDIARGSVVLERGVELGPAQLGVLASIAASDVSVYGRPRVAILATGNEIADLTERDAILAGRKIASSNSYTLISSVRQSGGEPVALGIARDDPQDLRDRFLAAADGADLLVTSGGVSVGDHDHLRPVFRDLGGEIEFWRLRMRPGAPVAFGLLRGLPWIGLPGNPVSTMVTFELFVRPAIRKLAGHGRPFRRTVRVRTREPIALQAPLRHFLRVVVEETEGELTAVPTGPQGSGILTSMAKADALMIVPEDRQTVPDGSVLDAILLQDPYHVERAPF